MAGLQLQEGQSVQGLRWQVIFPFLFSWLCHSVSGQIHYSINEELRKGSIVGNLAKDLELNVKDLSRRKLRIVSKISEKYFTINQVNGNLYIADRIDRETLCGAAADCVLTFDAVVENPLNIFSVQIDIQDINDNPPTFLHSTLTLKMSEYTSPGAKFALKKAEDLDVGVNSLISYRLSENQYFALGDKVSTDGSVFPELILEKPLDRETQNKHELILTASDGGNPVQTGTALINIIITDFNDNSPVFTQDVYKVSVRENIPVNSTILQISASDEDEGVNAQITYSFSNTAKTIFETFIINQNNGEIKVKGQLDYEVNKCYDISVQAEDGGGLAAHAKVLIEITDENDNAPEISITSSSDHIPEDSPPGSMVALIQLHDPDSGENGEVQCMITGDLPFELISSANNFHKIVTKRSLDREIMSSYNITIQASDNGSPQRSSSKVIRLDVSDVNDNAPVFEKLGYISFVTENNLPGASIFSIQATDLDSEDNAKISYSIMTRNNEEEPLSSYVSMNPVTGVIYAQRSFDYEKHKEFNIQIIAKDNGSPSLNSSTTLRISIVDQNDNSPVILYPSPEVDSSIFEMVPWTSEQGSLVSKVVAVDADSGHNAWLSYVLQSSEPSLFTIDQHTGEIRTSRGFHEKDIMKHGIVVLVKDNGIPSRSASVTLTMVIADHFHQVLPELSSQTNKEESQSNLQFYLVIALALISFFFMLTVIIAVVSKYKESKSCTSFGSLSTSLYPQVDPRFLSQFSNGTLPLPYSYDVCVTLDPSEQEFAFLKPPHNVPVDSLIDADDSGMGSKILMNSSSVESECKGTCQFAVSGQRHYSITEELRKGSIVGNLAKELELNDKDLSRRKLRIVSKISEKYFRINQETGNLYIADRIDRETLCRAAADCILTFDAVVENPLNIFSVQIDIQDINDNPPTFPHSTLTLKMSESTSPGAKFALKKAQDLDVGVNSLISYRLNENQYFALGEKVSTDGSVFPELILEKPLDRETQNKHELILTASDGGNPVQTGTALINIIINDINDNSPVFTQDVYKVSVRENIPVNSTILQVSASDEDEGVNAQITYSFSNAENTVFESFTINANTGEIKIKGQLDYEVIKFYDISVQAEDGGGLAAHAKVLIEITDENDNAPEISITSSSDLIPEDSHPGTMVALIQLHDPDSGENGEIQCMILGDSLFELISTTGNFFKIVTKRSLDREIMSSYNITIQASDKGSPQRSSSKVIRLDVSDVNDNAPVFEKIGYTAFVTENNLPGASIFSIQARDLDSEDNAKISYSIMTRNNEEEPMSSYVSMNPATGVIYAQKSFDYEKHKEFNIQIIAKDNGSPSLNSSTTLRICIVDQNDNSPVILYPSPEVGISTFEMVPWTSEQGSLVYKVVAVDADSGHNAWLSYFVQSSESLLFTIDQHTGEIKTSRGFHEKDITKHGIVVLVKDNGTPSRSASVTLTMVIADHFHQALPELNSQTNKEESQSNLQFYLVIALALISFFFMLTVIIAVVSKYKGSKSSTSFGSLSTSLYPQVDPRFLSQFSNGTLPLPYSYDVCVTLDPSEQEFAFLKPPHNVPVDSLIDADDSGIGSKTLMNSSSLETQIHYSINEELRKGSIVGNLAKDLELNVKDLSRRKLRIVSKISEKYFSINQDNGNLYIAGRIDRETLCRAAADCVLTFDAVVENPINIFNVKIDIQDINDNPPTFLHDILTLEMSELSSPGRRFILQKAQDLDVGVNSLISYRLSENQYFALGEKVSTDGSVFPELILEKPLDRETQNKHELILTASDGGNPVQTGTALINIIITDFNDNSPVFTQDVYKVSVRENIPVNSTILQVSASDEDEGVNAQITYSFSNADMRIFESFSINPNNGEIKIKGLIDYEVNKYYDISVEAKDGGGLAAHTKVLIEITDENDNSPEISITSSSDLIPEDSPPGTVVALIQVHDPDSEENGEVQCIITGNLPFELILSSGNFYKIVTKNSLDREKISSYNITIQASDKGSPEMISRKVIRLDVSDVNDNAPMFEKISYTTFIPENNSPGASIFSIQARDLDSDDNAKITYSILTSSNEEDPLSLYISMNPVTGVIYAQRSFDYEKNNEFNIQIIARDNGSPSLNSSTTLRISIVDQNDNSPVILYPSPEVDSSTFEMVPWTSEQGSLVSKVVAVDADSGHNAWLSYFLQSSEPSLFTIDQHTGEIRTSRGFHEKDIMKHGIVVLVKDNGIPSRSASVTLTMVIADHFLQVLPELSSQSNKEESQSNLQFYLVIALALISFFFMLTVVIAVVSKYKDSKSSALFGSMSTSLYPQIDPRFISQFNTGTLPLPYSYDVCVTLDPSEREFAFLKPQNNVPVDSLIDADDSGMESQTLKNASLAETQISIEKSHMYSGISAQIHYSINEELRKGSIVGNLAKDLELDVKDLSRRKLRIVSDVSQKYFSVNLDNGNLYIADRIDRETLCRAAADCVLTFDAVVENPLNVFSLKIDIQDINDNPPTFLHETLKLEMSELSSPGRKFILQKAEDLDVGVNSLISYRLSENQYFALGEKVSTDGSVFPELILEKPLDRETQNKHELILTASDGGNPVQTGTALINIIINDINDNSPVFTQDVYKVSVRENIPVNSTILQVSASDEDEGVNAQITYSFSNTEKNIYETFTINPNNGEIRIQGQIDYEVNKHYDISVEAKDGGGLAAHAKVLLEITDENDNAPEISITSSSGLILEDSPPGTVVALIKAHDRDSGENGEVRCIITGNLPFELISSPSNFYKIVTKNYLDREKILSYNITIQASDKGSPEKTSIKVIRLDVSDVNDNAPLFEKVIYTAFIPENNSPGASIFSMQARDLDSEKNAKITYSIMTTSDEEDSLSSYISMNPVTGVIFAQRSFDYEKHKEFNIHIIARDNGSPSLNSSTTLRICIVDQNDNSPVILYPSPEVDSSTFEMVPWTSEQGSLVSKVVAVDADSGHNAWLSYFLQSSELSLFTIDHHTGEIRTSRGFHEKDIMKHGIVVLVKDNGIPSRSASVTLTMVIADHFHQVLPELSSQSNKEESQSNLQFYLVTALALISFFFMLTVIIAVVSKCKDSKSSSFGSLSTNLYPPMDPRFISQFNPGTLPLPYSYDVCVTLDPSENEFAFLKPQHNVPVDSLIDADDSGMGSETLKNSALLETQDINDNPPTFLHETLTLEMSESSSPGRKFLLLNAQDLDVGVNSLISYRLSENQYFALGEKVSTDGSVFPELILEKALDRETQNKHELILTASDGGNPVQTGTALINIIITDFNDNSPVFTQDVYKVSVRENIPVNSTILQVSASDEDEGVNAQITYSFSNIEKNIFETFTINPNNGEIKIKGQIDYEGNKYYDIIVQAKDGGGLAAHAKVLLEIIDENDNAPEISITSSSDLILEDSPPGTVVALIKAHDRDSGENGEVRCIITGNLPFELISSPSNFYKIVTKNYLDREKISSYNITIQASDKGSPEMTSRKVIRVGLSDVNDNAPVFEKVIYTAFIPENNSPGASILNIQARDLDSEKNAKITYSVMTTSDEEDSLSSYISMNPVTGVIYAQRSFDYEKHKEFNIQIIARDNGSPSLNSSTTLRICIVDQNDNSPVILYPSPEVDSSSFEMVPWTSEQGSLVSKVVAVDADSGHNAWLSYFLQSSEPSLFTIDHHTGEIRTSRGFHEKDIMKHGIVVLVKDNGIPSRSASVTLTMVIADHFHQVLPELSSQSNKEESQSNLQFYLVIALALISFFFMLTVIIAVVSKFKESKSSSFGSLSTNLYPPMDPRFISQFNPGTLPLPYSYDVCVTLDPSENEFAFLKPQHNVPVDSLIDADDSGMGSETLKNSSLPETQIY
ncbi:protocadherin Fat 4-like [Anomaloglossus baeobatrachus]|uniref:protocadherin Fat 4-like n=1 Tax=Anomaloglossus baeobatrachus TaxID=238106 RepID=UPI003F501AD5